MILTSVLAVWLAGAIQAAWFSPRVVSPHIADTYSVRTFAQFHQWRHLSGDEKVFEVFQYLTDRQTGLYPLGAPAREGVEDLPEYDAVTDPVKMLNVYPMGHCGTLGPTAAGILEGMGIGPARTLIIPGWNHVAAEVFYEGRWHYFDLDVRAVFQREDGILASMAEVRTNASCWDQPNSARFFPLDHLASVRRAYAQEPPQYRYGVASGGHTMDFVLRQGETFTRWWQPQGGRWNHHPSYAVEPFPRTVIERDPRGPKSKHESFTVHTHGNGRFVYRPNLTARSSDFEDGVYDSLKVRPGAAGLTLISPGEGYAIFEVRTPYVIVPWVGDLDTTRDDREASMVKLDASGASLSLSVDHGLTWKKLSITDGTVDLTQYVAGSYGYLLRTELRGRSEEAVLRSLEIVTWVQVHPATLPALRKGQNVMRILAGDHYGLPSRVVAITPHGGDREGFLKHLHQSPDDYGPGRSTSRVRGSMVAKVKAPPRTRIAWFSAGASFRANVGDPGSTLNTIGYSTSKSGSFLEIYRANVPPDQSHWHYNADREVRLVEPARAVFVKFTGIPALNNFRIFAHCVEDGPRPDAAMVVTHTWREQGVRRTRQVKVDGPCGYEIEVNTEPSNESIEMAIPSAMRAASGPSRTAIPPTKVNRAGEDPRPFPRVVQSPAEPWFPQAPALPLPAGEVIRVTTVEELVAAVKQLAPGGTVLVADGHYFLPRCLRVHTDEVTLRSESGDRSRVVLDGARCRDGELVALNACSGVTIADLTVQNVRHNGIKINSDSNVQRVTLYNCILHNIWQRAVKGVKVPLDQKSRFRPKECRIQYCLFYNDRPKRFDDDPADTPQNFGGNYVGGIDVMYAQRWTISDNVFVGIQGRTRSARGAVFLWHETEDCVIERNIIIDCDTGIALGNSHKPDEVPVHATRCVMRNNFITRAPENGIVADYTRDCQIVHNTIHDPTNRLGRLIRLVHDNDGLVVANNLLSGPPLRNESTSRMSLRHNLSRNLTDHFVDAAAGDLHLKQPLPEGIESPETVEGLTEDIDRQPRRGRSVLGADEPAVSIELPGIGVVERDSISSVSNPIMPGADPHALVLGDTVWLYPTWSDKSRGERFFAFSSKNLTDWKQHGPVLDFADVNWVKDDGQPWHGAWAPCLLARGGKTYFYYSVGPQNPTPSRIGVAVGDSPAGPFQDSGKPLLTGGSGFEAIDPMVFTDPNSKKTYLYAGGSAGATLRVFEMNADLVSFAREIPVDTPPKFTEGAFMHSYEGRYYLSYSHGGWREASYSVHYATSDSPIGPWHYRGAILTSDATRKGPGHHSFIQQPGTGEWLIVYHRWENRAGDGPYRGSRQVCIDLVKYGDEGLIQPVTMTGSGHNR